MLPNDPLLRRDLGRGFLCTGRTPWSSSTHGAEECGTCGGGRRPPLTPRCAVQWRAVLMLIWV
jgi:hypothetical protein